ncbi:MAG: hypothetical protein J5843_03250 [Clostridia bacterium]|nr:hypothetical protein [Clostridia bacterium]
MPAPRFSPRGRAVGRLLCLLLILSMLAGCAGPAPASEPTLSGEDPASAPSSAESEVSEAESEPSGDPDESADPGPEPDFWDRNGQARLPETWAVPDYCIPLGDDSPLYDTGLHLSDGSETIYLNGHYLHLFNYDSGQYRLVDLLTGSEIQSFPFDPQLLYTAGKDGFLYSASPFTMEVRAFRPDGTVRILRNPDDVGQDASPGYPLVSEDGHFLLRYDDGAQTIRMEDLETGTAVSFPSATGISSIEYVDRESVCVLQWSGTMLRLYLSGESASSEEAEWNERAQYSHGFRFYSRHGFDETMFLFRAFPGNDGFVSAVVPEPDASHWTLSCGILGMTTSREDRPFLFADLRAGICLEPCALPDLRYIHSLAVSEEGFALVSANIGGSTVSVFLYDLTGADPSEPLLTEERTAEEMRSETGDILEKLRADGIDVFYGSEGNDFLIGDYVGEVLKNPDLSYINIQILYRVLTLYPEGMLREAWEGADGYEGIQLYLCGTLYGVFDSGLGQAAAVTSEISTRIVIAFDCSSEHWTDDIPHELSHLFDRRIETASRETGVDWIGKFESLSPRPYANTYQDYGKLIKYTSDGTSDPSQIWYIDCYARTFSTEDRARLIEYLFRTEEDGMHHLLEPEHIQYKAKAYCYILRKCFNSLSGKAAYWERYLDMSGFTLE